MTTAPAIDAVLLAAGGSRRFGGHKLLARGADGASLAAHSLAPLLAAGLRGIVVVLGHGAEAVAATLPAGPHRVLCPDHASGLSHSLRCGLDALPGDGDAVLIALADMPGAARATRALIAAWRPLCVAVPVHGGMRGHPVLWDRCFVPRMRQAKGDRGAGFLLADPATRLIELPWADPAVLEDADTPEALARLPGGPWVLPASPSPGPPPASREP